MKNLKLLLTAASALTLLAATPAGAETFRMAPATPIATMDVHGSGDTNSRNIMINIIEGLVRWGKKGDLEPELAVSWEPIEPTVWRFKLRPNVFFHDGSPFTADDVVTSFNRATGAAADLRPKLRAIKEMKKIDDLTVDAITNGPNPVLPKSVLIFLPIMSKIWLEKNNAMDAVDPRKGGAESYASRHANGTGPYKVVSYGADGKIELAANDKWWDKREGDFSEVVITPISSDSTRVAALLSGEVDVIQPVPQQDVARISSTKGFQILSGPEARTVFFGFNQWRDELWSANVKGKNPFKDVRVREAFVRAIDVDLIKDKILRGAAVPIFAMVPPVADGWDPSFATRPAPSVDIAKKLLADAGYPQGFSFTMNCPADGTVSGNMGEPLCVAISAMLARVGVKAEVDLQKQSPYSAKMSKQEVDFYLHSWGATTFDALATMESTVLSHKDNFGIWNVGGYSNAEVDALINGAATEMDLKKRTGMLTKALDIHRKEIGALPLYQQMMTYAATTKVSVTQRADDSIQLRWVKGAATN